MFILDATILFYPFWGLDVDAIKSSIANSWQANKFIFIVKWLINDMLTLVAMPGATSSVLALSSDALCYLLSR